MFKKAILTFFFILAGLCTSSAAGGYTLVIDAGHGGHDAGAKGAYSQEKDINLKVALAFGQYVEQNCKDVKVIYTRKTDKFIPLKERANIANRNNADLFVSVHTNALPSGRIARGFEVYTLGMHRAKDNLDVAMRENSVIEEEANYKKTYQGFDPKSSESYIMFEFMQSANMLRSVELAKLIESNVCATADRNNMGVHQAGFLVLRETSMPSCLIELGFITTPDEEDYLNTDEGIDKLANGIYKAFVEYKNKYPGKSAAKSSSKSDASKSDSTKPDTAVTTTSGAATANNATTSNTIATPSASDKEESTALVPAKKTEAVTSDSQPSKVAPATAAKPVKKTEVPKQTVAKKTTTVSPAVTKPKEAVKKPVEVAKKPEETSKKAADTSKKPVEATKKPAETVKKPSAVTKSSSSIKDAPVFKVQVFAVSRKLAASDPLFKGHADVASYTEPGSSLIKYTIGSDTNYNAIVELKNSLRNDFPQAYIVSFKDGKPIELSKAISEYNKNKRKQNHNKK